MNKNSNSQNNCTPSIKPSTIISNEKDNNNIIKDSDNIIREENNKKSNLEEIENKKINIIIKKITNIEGQIENVNKDTCKINGFDERIKNIEIIINDKLENNLKNKNIKNYN